MQALAEHMMFQWEDRQELKMADLSFSDVMRSMLITPASEKLEYLGEFPRITKPVKQSFNPVVYGPLGNIAYLATIKGCAKNQQTGVKALRRTIDHMAAFNHVPSQEIIHAVAAECVEGKWPATALSFMNYLLKKNISITSSAVSDVVSLLRRTQGCFEKSIELAKSAVSSGCITNSWSVIEPPVLKYLKHYMIKEATELVEECAKLAGRVKYSEDAAVQDKKAAEEQVRIYVQMVKCLLQAKLSADAFAAYSKWLVDNKSKEAVALGLSIYEKMQDIPSATKFLEQVQKSKDFEVDRPTLISILKIARNAETQGVAMADKYLSYLFNPKVYSPFALNLVFMIYGTKHIRRVTEVCTRVADNGLYGNHFTYITLSTILRSTPDGPEREALVAQFKKINFPEPPKDNKQQA